jgi:hypothetical protein
MQKRIEPTEFQPALASSDTKLQEGNKPWGLALAVALILVAIYGVFIWLPGQVTPTNLTSAQANQTSTSTQTPNRAGAELGSPASELSPFEQAQLEKVRKEAQDVLEQILLQQEVLQEAKVELWGQAPYEQALTRAREGDQYYRDRDFASAIAGYSAALEQLVELSDGIPARANVAEQQTRDAIEAFDPQTAVQQLNLLEALAPNHGSIATLTQRIEALPQTAQYFDNAQQARSQSNWSAAKVAIDAAAKVDPAHQTVSLAQAEILAKWQQAMFEETLGQAYAAIADNEFGIAARLIQEAGAFKGSSEALNQVKATLTLAETTATLRQLEQEANAAIQRENWQGVINLYQEALTLDPSIQFAQQGLPNAHSRLQLDQEIDAVLKAPERLQDPAIAAAAQRLLDQALHISPAGPSLTLQIQTLDNLIEQANRIVSVTIESDGLTDLVLIRHSNIGATQRYQARLRSGKYTVRGTRVGFRDILVNFEVNPDDSDLRVFAACREPI